jgi:hypothetical protein
MVLLAAGWILQQQQQQNKHRTWVIGDTATTACNAVQALEQHQSLSLPCSVQTPWLPDAWSCKGIKWFLMQQSKQSLLRAAAACAEQVSHAPCNAVL